jgi:metallo-beta-lactamase class B
VCDGALALAKPPAPRGGGPGRGRQGGPPAPPARETWYAEPVKVFDNMYFVGQTEFSAWAITTSQGIIILDAIFDYSVEEEVAGGLKKLGLDPADIKYVIISHGHLDHAGGAKYLQEKFGSRLIMSAADYDLLDQQNPSWKPKRDMVATDGMKVTLGDTTLTLYLTPGHTDGTISTLIPLRDGTQKHLAAAWGGTLFNFGANRPRLAAYTKSAERFRDIVTKAGADVILSNHTAYDGSKAKLPAVLARKPGEKHPYVVGSDVVRRYLTVAHECGQAALAIVPQ